jgi:hypothetical protein
LSRAFNPKNKAPDQRLPVIARDFGQRSEGARGFKSAFLRQAGSDLRHSLENTAKFAQVRGFPQP